jgi:hypothetical protein
VNKTLAFDKIKNLMMQLAWEGPENFVGIKFEVEILKIE